MNKSPIYNHTPSELAKLFAQLQLKDITLSQVENWFFKKTELDFSKWDKVSKETIKVLEDNFDFSMLKVLWSGKSSDGTRKFLIGMPDGQSVESVAIPSRDRLTLCISSQVGCAIGCTFCHTGTMGLKRHLQPFEIVGQFLTISHWLKNNDPEFNRITNIVFMGQGEPLHNFENVKKAITIFLSPNGIALSKTRVTLSTSGLTHQIEKWDDFPDINIAVSLHAVTDELRTKLMPINKAHDLQRLFKALKTIPVKTSRRITYEYLLIAGLNDRIEDVEGLCNLLTRKESKINLIPFNEYPGSEFKKPSKDKVEWFQNEMHKRGYTCTIRTTKGDDILAACGQLKSEYEKLNLW